MAIAKKEAMPGDRVRLGLRIVLARQAAEALSARAIRGKRNLEGRGGQGAWASMIVWLEEAGVWLFRPAIAPALWLTWGGRK